jgi:hypothetical protein
MDLIVAGSLPFPWGFAGFVSLEPLYLSPVAVQRRARYGSFGRQIDPPESIIMPTYFDTSPDCVVFCFIESDSVFKLLVL